MQLSFLKHRRVWCHTLAPMNYLGATAILDITARSPRVRAWRFLQPPAAFGIAPCTCGNSATGWSELDKHLRCDTCGKDFVPAHRGVFDGPIRFRTAHLEGLNFDRLNLQTGEVEHFDPKKLKYVDQSGGPVQPGLPVLPQI
jgi:hypothetical protein